ncbi:MAG: molybdopterin-binding protein [Blautia sp.]|nr:molybdopterin-binding protein [Blautia sp.]
MKLMKTEEAVGQILCHDMTQIIPGVKKDAAFKKGHIIKEEDIPVLLSMGKEHVYIWENNENMLHENDAAQILYDLSADEHMHPFPVKEGKIELIADTTGLLKIDRVKLLAINSLGNMMIASRHGDFPVFEGDTVAGTRVIPLVIEKERMEEAKAAAKGGPIFRILPFKEKKVGIVATGNEVLNGLIEDKFTPVMEQKIKEYRGTVAGHALTGDDKERTAAAVLEFIENGAEIVICTGGMSVDPDDRTPAAIKNTGARIVSYGSPVLPGAMFLLSYYGEKNIPVIGVPGCAMYNKRTVLDLVLPHLFADDILEKADLDRLGEGGLCLNCPVCHFPNCGFGK